MAWCPCILLEIRGVVFCLRNCEGVTCLLSIRLLSTYYVPGATLGTGDKGVSKRDKKGLPSLSLQSDRRGQKINKTQHVTYYTVINAIHVMASGIEKGSV